MHAGIMNRQVNQNDPEWLGFIKMDKHQSQCACQSYNSKKPAIRMQIAVMAFVRIPSKATAI